MISDPRIVSGVQEIEPETHTNDKEDGLLKKRRRIVQGTHVKTITKFWVYFIVKEIVQKEPSSSVPFERERTLLS